MSPAPYNKRALTSVAAILLAIALVGCRAKRGVEDQHAAPPEPRAAVSAAPPQAPVDQALPGELAEGTFRAFGLLLPRVMNVSARFDDVVFATGDAPPEQVANYMRQRVNADKIVTGPEKTVFSRATVKAHPGQLVGIMVVSKGGRTELEVRDVTLKHAKDGLSSDERWRELGLSPDGTPLDPTRLR